MLLRGAFSQRPALENAVRTWATVDAGARSAVQAIDLRRIGYIEVLLKQAGLSAETARARAQILYWTFVGYALSEQPLAESAATGRGRGTVADGGVMTAVPHRCAKASLA